MPTFDADDVFAHTLGNHGAIGSADQFQKVVDGVDRWVNTLKAVNFMTNGQRIGVETRLKVHRL